MITFKCIYCDTVLAAEDFKSGGKIQCLSCSESVVVPDKVLAPGTEFEGYTIQNLVTGNMLWNTYRAVGLTKSFGNNVLISIPTLFIIQFLGDDFNSFCTMIRDNGSLGIEGVPEIIDASYSAENPYFVYQSYNSCSILSEADVNALFKSEYDAVRMIRKVTAALMKLEEEFNMNFQALKPDMICVYPEGKVHILGAGLSQFALQYPELADLGLDLWSYSYTAPEFLAGQNADGAAIDIYSLGGVLFYMLTGSDPLDDSNNEYGLSIVDANNIRKFNPTVPDSIEELFRHLYDKSDSQRVSNYRDVIRLIDDILAESDAANSKSGYHDTNTIQFDMSALIEEPEDNSDDNSVVNLSDVIGKKSQANEDGGNKNMIYIGVAVVVVVVAVIAFFLI